MNLKIKLSTKQIQNIVMMYINKLKTEGLTKFEEDILEELTTQMDIEEQELNIPTSTTVIGKSFETTYWNPEDLARAHNALSHPEEWMVINKIELSKESVSPVAGVTYVIKIKLNQEIDIPYLVEELEKYRGYKVKVEKEKGYKNKCLTVAWKHKIKRRA